MSPVETLTVRAVDYYPLGAKLYGAEGSQGPVFIINGATGVPQRYYRPFAEWLEGQGGTVLTFDFRGIGESRPKSLKGFPARARDWGQLDFEGAIRFAKQKFPGRELVLIGHSIGGQLIGMTPSAHEFSRIFTVAAQVGSWRDWPGMGKWAMAGLWYALMPAAVTLVGYYPGKLGMGADLPAGMALEWASWGRHRDYLLRSIPREGYERLTAPFLSYSFSDDFYAPKNAVDKLHAIYSRATVERVHLSPKELGVKQIGHFGFFRERFREALWERARPFLFGSTPSLRSN